MMALENEKIQQYFLPRIFWLPEQLEGFYLKENYSASKNLKDKRNLLTVAIAV